MRVPESQHPKTVYGWLRAFLAVRPYLSARLRECSSGRELTERGFGEDLTWAAAFGVSGAVPLLQGGAYRSVGGSVN